MPRMGFEPTTPVFEREKTVRATDRADPVTGGMMTNGGKKEDTKRKHAPVSVWELNHGLHCGMPSSNCSSYAYASLKKKFIRSMNLM
jgi:hypothetical protein